MDGTSVSSETRYRAEETKNRSESDSVPSDVSVDLVSKLDWAVEESFEAIRDEWLELQASAVLTPFQFLEWCESWYESSGRESGAQLRILTARDSNRLVLLFPMVLFKRWGLNCLTWMGGIWNDYNAPIVDAALLQRLSNVTGDAIRREIANLVPEADFLSLQKQPCVLYERSNPFLLLTDLETDAAHSISLGSDWETFEKERWGKSTRKDIRKKRNQLERQGELRFCRIETASERQNCIDRILRWKSDDLDRKGARNPFRDECSWRFFREVASRWDRLDIHMLELNANPIAGALSLADGPSSVVYQSSYDMSYDRQSPGHLLFQEMIRDHIRQGKTSLDFGYGDEGYKQKLTDKSLTLVRGLYGFSLLGKLACIVERTILALKKVVKSKPKLLQLYYSLRARRRSDRG